MLAYDGKECFDFALKNQVKRVVVFSEEIDSCSG